MGRSRQLARPSKKSAVQHAHHVHVHVHVHLLVHALSPRRLMEGADCPCLEALVHANIHAKIEKAESSLHQNVMRKT